MAYDSTNGVTVLFGGYDSGGRDDETWIYDAGSDSWTLKAPSSKPSVRQDHAMVYDSAEEVIVLFGGDDAGGYDDETWTYNVATNTWTSKSPSSNPPARRRFSMVYDSAEGIIVLFGGIDSSSTKDDTWNYNTGSNSWVHKAPPSKPTGRDNYAMAYNSDRGDIVLFGGYSDSSQLDTHHYRLTDYETAGTYTSKADAAHADRSVKWGTIDWNAELPLGSDVEFQVAVSSDGTSWAYKGPDGTSSTYYNDVTGGDLYSGYSGKWVRYKAYLRAAPSGDTPELHDVTITWREMTVPSVELTWPNGGENLMHGESYPITWTASGDMKDSTPVALSYSLDGGNSWTTITSATENDGHYLWTLPSNENVERAMVKIVVTALDSSTVEDTSDGSFSIDPPPGNPDTMDRVLSPSLGDELTQGEVATIKWRLRDEESISLYYSTDFGQNWNVICDDLEGVTSYSWKIPDDLTAEDVIIKVKGKNAEITSGVFMVSEATGGEGGSEGTDVEDSDDPHRVVTGGLTALIIGLLVAIVVVARYKPKEKKRKEI